LSVLVPAMSHHTISSRQQNNTFNKSDAIFQTEQSVVRVSE
jgi:hypothetical protein